MPARARAFERTPTHALSRGCKIAVEIILLHEVAGLTRKKESERKKEREKRVERVKRRMDQKKKRVYKS